MKINRIFIAAILLPLLISCVKGEINGGKKNEQGFDVAITVSAGESEIQSKAYFADGIGLYWKATGGEMAGIVSSENNIQSLILSGEDIKNSDRQAEFHFTGVFEGDYYLYYPYHPDAADSKIPVYVSAVQTSSPGASGDIFAAVSTEKISLIPEDGDTGNSYNSADAHFTVVGSYIKFLVYGGAEGEMVKSINIREQNSGKIQGVFTVDPLSKSVIGDSYDTGDNILINLGQEENVNVNKDEARGIYAAIIPGSFQNTYEVKTSRGTYSFESGSAKEFKNGSIKNIPLNLSLKEPVPGTLRISASLESLTDAGSQTKALLEGTTFKWEENDSFSLLGVDPDNMKMTLSSGAGGTTGVFDGSQDVNADAGKVFYAVYPYTESASIAGDGVKGVLPESQVLGKLSAVMVAKGVSGTGSLDFEFKNVFSVIRIPLTGNGETLTGVIFRGNNSEIIAGEYTVTDFENPVAVFSEDGKKIINAPSSKITSIVLGDEPVILDIVVPAMTFSKGVTVRFNTSVAGVTYARTFENQLVCNRNTVTELEETHFPLPKPVYEWSKGYLTIDENGYRFTDTDREGGTETIGLYFRYNSSVGVYKDVFTDTDAKNPVTVWYYDETSKKYTTKQMLFTDVPINDGGDPCERVAVAEGEKKWMTPTEKIWRTWAYKTVDYNAQRSYNVKDSRNAVYTTFDTDPSENESLMYLFESKILTGDGGVTNNGWTSMWIKTDVAFAAGNNLQYIQFKPSVASNANNPAYKTYTLTESATSCQAHQIRCCRQTN